jgi:hypothetical protein
MSHLNWKLLFCLAALLPALSGPAGAADVVVRQFTGGTGQNAVGIIDASEDTEIAGPQALTADDDGSLFLLDQVNNRILRFDPKDARADPSVFGLPDEIQPTDLVVHQNDILVWDGAIHKLQPAGPEPSTRDIGGPSFRKLEEVSTRGPDDAFAVSAFAQMGSQPPGSESDLLDADTRAVESRKPRARSRQYVASRGAGSVVVDVIPEKGDASAQIEIRRQEDMEAAPLAHLKIRVRDRLGAVEFLEIDHSGRMFVFAENIPTSGLKAAAFVARFAANGALEGIYELPLSNVPLSRRFVAVSGDGDVYFLRTQAGAVDVLGVGFRPIANGKVIDIRPATVATAARPTGRGPISAVRPLTRQQTIETAFAFESIQWKLTAPAYGRDPDTACTGFNGRVRRPTYLHHKLGQEVRGIPYCWGCMGSLEQIRAKIERGVLAGNICTRNQPRSDVTGVDCSAFVSATWGLATQYTTSAIPSIASRVANPWDLRPGDALNKSGSHVMLFLRFTPDRKAEVMEASPGACNGRVCRNVYPLASLLARGYVPVRYRALLNDTSVVAQAVEQKTEKPEAKAKQPAESKHKQHLHRR